MNNNNFQKFIKCISNKYVFEQLNEDSLLKIKNSISQIIDKFYNVKEGVDYTITLTIDPNDSNKVIIHATEI